MMKFIRLVLLLFLSYPAFAGTIVGRMMLDHPTLGTTGGAGLHTSIETIYTTISNHSDSRYYTHSAVANSTTVTEYHNFGVALTELEVIIYTGTHPNLTVVSDPVAAGWTIAATGGFLKEKIDVITPSSGGPHTFSVVIYNNSSVPRSLAKGGTNKALTAVNGGLAYSDADSLEITSAGTAQQWVLSGGAGAPTMSNTTTTAKVIDGSADNVQLTVQGHSTQTSDVFQIQNSAAAVSTSLDNQGDLGLFGGGVNPRVQFSRANTSLQSPSIVSSSSQLSRIVSRAYDGNSYDSAAEIRVTMDGTPGDGDLPAMMELMVSPDGSASPSTAIGIDNTRRVTLSKTINITKSADQVISAGALTWLQTHSIIDTQAAAATDTLCTLTGANDGDFLILRTTASARDVTITEEASEGGGNCVGAAATGSFSMNGGNFTLSDARDFIVFVYAAGGINRWLEVSRSDNN